MIAVRKFSLSAESVDSPRLRSHERRRPPRMIIGVITSYARRMADGSSSHGAKIAAFVLAHNKDVARRPATLFNRRYEKQGRGCVNDQIIALTFQPPLRQRSAQCHSYMCISRLALGPVAHHHGYARPFRNSSLSNQPLSRANCRRGYF